MKSANALKTENVLDFASRPVAVGRLPHSFAGIIEKVKPLFAGWLDASGVFEKNTIAVGAAIKQTYALFMKEFPEGTRVGFARYFDTSIAEDARTRDLKSNAVYNRLNYLLDKVGREASEGEASEERETITAKRERMRSDLERFRRKFRGKALTFKDVEVILRAVLGELWKPEAVDEVLAA